MKIRTGARAILNLGIFLGCVAISGPVTAATLPKGNCADPKPFTDLRSCRFKGANLQNRDLQGTDLRGIHFYKAQLQGANLKDALFDGRYISYANLDGVIGLPSETLSILKNSYLATPNGKDDYSIVTLPSDYKGSNENIAGLDNVFMAQSVQDTQSTVALLAYPKYGDGQTSAILARFQNGKFELPACYQSINLLNEDRYYYPRWSSMKVKLISNGDYLIGVLTSGADGDDMGSGGWDMIAFLTLSPTCKLSLLHKENNGWAEGPDHTSCRGDHIDFRLIDERSAEILMTAHTCDSPTNSKPKIAYKKITLNLLQ